MILHLRSVPLVLWLTVVWVGLWGTLSVANVLGGLVVAIVLVLALPLTAVPDRALVRPLAVLRLLGFFAVDLVLASGHVVVAVLRPRVHLHQAVVAVEVRGASDHLLTLLANAISLTPGTLTLEVDRPRSTLYVHALDIGSGDDAVERVRAAVLHLERLAILAVGSAECRRSLSRQEVGS